MSRSHDKHPAQLERKAKALFDESVERLDGHTCSKLTQARHRALEELNKGTARRRWLLGPAGGLVAASIVALAVMLWPGAGPDRTPSQPGGMALDDLEIVADSESLEMLEDLEFYAWLDER